MRSGCTPVHGSSPGPIVKAMDSAGIILDDMQAERSSVLWIMQNEECETDCEVPEWMFRVMEREEHDAFQIALRREAG